MSSNNLSDLPQNIAVAQVVHHGTELTLPVGMKIDEAIVLLERRQSYLEEDTRINASFEFFPYDGAIALNTVLERMFGWSPAEPVETFFGKMPPSLIEVEVAPNEYKKVPWGRFSLPGMESGFIESGIARSGNMITFAIGGIVKRKYEAMIDALIAEVRHELRTNSIYRGKAVKIRFRDDDGDLIPMPTPEFMDLTDVDENMLIYSEDVQREMETNLFFPIERTPDLIAAGIAIKRGVLLAGTYGVGKTLGAKVAAKKSVQTGNTFVYIPHADELANAVEFAKMYQSPACTIFCEDIDRALQGERTVEMDDILNIIDGIDTKTCNIITVLTTNHIDKINPTMLRPGRLDAIINVTPPDEEAVKKLLRVYGGEAIESSTNLDEAARVLKGNIPAVIAEVVKRAWLAQLRYVKPGEQIRNISEAAIIEAANSIASHVRLLDRRSAEQTPKLPALESVIVECVKAAITDQLGALATVSRLPSDTL